MSGQVSRISQPVTKLFSPAVLVVASLIGAATASAEPVGFLEPMRFGPPAETLSPVQEGIAEVHRLRVEREVLDLARRQAAGDPRVQRELSRKRGELGGIERMLHEPR